MCRTGTHLGPWPGSSGPQGPRGARLRGSATRTNVLNDNNDVTQPTGLTYMYNVFLSFAHRRFSSRATSGGEHIEFGSLNVSFSQAAVLRNPQKDHYSFTRVRTRVVKYSLVITKLLNGTSSFPFDCYAIGILEMGACCRY